MENSFLPPLPGEKGFSLIEIIATLLIIGILGIGVASYFAYSVEGFLLARANNEAFQKVNTALERLVRETKNMDSIFQVGAGSMRYSRDGTNFGIARVGNTVRLIRADSIPTAATGAVLIDDVSGFGLQFLDAAGTAWTMPGDNSLTGLSRIVITLTVNVYDASRTFSVDINPLYNNTIDGPTS